MLLTIFDSLNWQGVGIGLVTFLIIGLFHPLVIKGEYYMGQRCNLLFLIGGIITLLFSLKTEGTASILLGVTSFSCFWSILEVKEQKKRVEKGWFPKRKINKKND